MRDPLPELVKTFKDETEARFCFLVQDHGFSREAGLSDSSSSSSLLKSWQDGASPSHFWVVQRFSRANMHCEIAYGDRELVLEGHWSFGVSQDKFGMWEILDAAERSDKHIRGSSWVDSVDYLKKILLDMADSLKKNIDLSQKYA
jgi:hypothetical protein